MSAPHVPGVARGACSPHQHTYTHTHSHTGAHQCWGRGPPQPEVSHTRVSLGACLMQMGAFYRSQGSPSQEPTSAGPVTAPPAGAPGSWVLQRPRGQCRALFTPPPSSCARDGGFAASSPGSVPQSASGRLAAPHHHREALSSDTCSSPTWHTAPSQAHGSISSHLTAAEASNVIKHRPLGRTSVAVTSKARAHRQPEA